MHTRLKYTLSKQLFLQHKTDVNQSDWRPQFLNLQIVKIEILKLNFTVLFRFRNTSHHHSCQFGKVIRKGNRNVFIIPKVDGRWQRRRWTLGVLGSGKRRMCSGRERGFTFGGTIRGIRRLGRVVK